MRRFLSLSLLVLCGLQTGPALAQDTAMRGPLSQAPEPQAAVPQAPVVELPVISYAQQVQIVVEAKKNPLVLDVRLDQKAADVTIAVIVDKDTDRETAKYIAFNLVMLAKTLSWDDKPTEAKKPGKGLYNYRVHVNRVDAVGLVNGSKKANEEEFKIDPPMMGDLLPEMRPWTRADAAGR